MFVECFSGLMGGGKSFYSVKRAAEHISNGGVVYSNIRFQLDPWFNEAYADKMKEFWMPECYDGCRVEMHKGGLCLPCIKREGDRVFFEYNSRGLKHYLRTEHRWPYQEGQYHYIPDESVGPDIYTILPQGTTSRPVMVILDEALDHFESNGQSSSSTVEFRSFLRHIRKLGINLIFIAQDFGSLDKKIRMLTHFVWRFRDMYTWPVPVFNRPLPMPWRDHIICEKFHRSQFGKTTAEPVNKGTWQWRDPDVFGCYQSVAMHNVRLKMAEGVQTDFSHIEKIEKKGAKVALWERLIIYSALAASLFFAVRSPAASDSSEVQTVETETVSSQKTEVKPESEPERLTMFCSGGFGALPQLGTTKEIYRLGDSVKGRKVVSISEDSVTLKDQMGRSETLTF
jgi:hypothetical protein